MFWQKRFNILCFSAWHLTIKQHCKHANVLVNYCNINFKSQVVFQVNRSWVWLKFVNPCSDLINDTEHIPPHFLLRHRTSSFSRMQKSRGGCLRSCRASRTSSAPPNKSCCPRGETTRDCKTTSLTPSRRTSGYRMQILNWHWCCWGILNVL